MGGTTRTMLVAVIAASTLAMAGCSGDEPAPPSVNEVTSDAAGTGPESDATANGGVGEPGAVDDGGSDVCALLDPGDLESLTGLGFDQGVFDVDLSSDTQHVCNWTHSGDTLAIVQVLVLPGAGDVTSQRDSAEQWMGPTTDVDVMGATDAYSVAAGSIVGMRVGDDFVQVSYMTADADDVTDTTVAIAEIAVANL